MDFAHVDDDGVGERVLNACSFRASIGRDDPHKRGLIDR
jgi:hypothetical protein